MPIATTIVMQDGLSFSLRLPEPMRVLDKTGRRLWCPLCRHYVLRTRRGRMRRHRRGPLVKGRGNELCHYSGAKLLVGLEAGQCRSKQLLAAAYLDLDPTCEPSERTP